MSFISFIFLLSMILCMDIRPFSENPCVLAYTRHYEHETLLIVNHLFGFVQPAERDPNAFKGAVSVELMGGVRFPPIGDLPYFLTFGPHSFYWFRLEGHLPPPPVSSGSADALVSEPSAT